MESRRGFALEIHARERADRERRCVRRRRGILLEVNAGRFRKLAAWRAPPAHRRLDRRPTAARDPADAGGNDRCRGDRALGRGLQIASRSSLSENIWLASSS